MILSNPEEEQDRLFKRELLSLGPEEAKAFREAYSKCMTIVNTRKRFDEAVAAADDPNYKLFSILCSSFIGRKLDFPHLVQIPMDLPIRLPTREEAQNPEVDRIDTNTEVEVEVEVIHIIEVIEVIEVIGDTKARVLSRILIGEVIIIVIKRRHLCTIETLFFFVSHSPP